MVSITAGSPVLVAKGAERLGQERHAGNREAVCPPGRYRLLWGLLVVKFWELGQAGREGCRARASVGKHRGNGT